MPSLHPCHKQERFISVLQVYRDVGTANIARLSTRFLYSFLKIFFYLTLVLNGKVAGVATVVKSQRDVHVETKKIGLRCVICLCGATCEEQEECCIVQNLSLHKTVLKRQATKTFEP